MSVAEYEKLLAALRSSSGTGVPSSYLEQQAIQVFLAALEAGKQ